MDDRISRDVFIYNTVKERIKAMYDLEEDDPALLDTLDGETSLNEKLILIAESALDDQAAAAACKARIEQYQARADRLLRRAEHKRSIIAYGMEETGQTKVPGATLTLSVRAGQRKLVIDDDKLAQDYKKSKVTYSPDKDAIWTAIDAGDVPDGVQIDNARPILTIRSK